MSISLRYKFWHLQIKHNMVTIARVHACYAKCSRSNYRCNFVCTFVQIWTYCQYQSLVKILLWWTVQMECTSLYKIWFNAPITTSQKQYVIEPHALPHINAVLLCFTAPGFQQAQSKLNCKAHNMSWNAVYIHDCLLVHVLFTQTWIISNSARYQKKYNEISIVAVVTTKTFLHPP